MKFADYKAFEMTADAVEKDMENFDRIAKTADAMHLDHAQFEAWAKLHHYDLVRFSHEPYAAYRSDLTNAALAGWRGANGESSAAQATGWYERLQAECTADHGEYPEYGLLADRLRWWVPKSVRHGSTTLEDDLRDAADSLCAEAPQPTHYQQLLGVAYVVLGCLVANGVDIPVRFLDAFSDPDSVENPLELLPCDFLPAQAVRAAVEAAKEGE